MNSRFGSTGGHRALRAAFPSRVAGDPLKDQEIRGGRIHA